MSDFLLTQLGIPQLVLPRARGRSTRQQTSISFWDVLDYMYVTQTRMDSSIVYHTDPILGRVVERSHDEDSDKHN